jgi:O-methyltransferase
MIKFLSKGVKFLFGKVLMRNNIFIGNSLDYLQRERFIDNNNLDYVRIATLELISHEINTKHIKGNVAELGVYKGKFAKHINQYFFDRTLYLFDTFEGFDRRDTEKELAENYSGGDQDFSNTSVEQVLQLMPYKNMCKPIKGFFPESATGVDDTFAFVSLDADLYDPIYSGLNFFYPKLSKGGYILIHDFNNDYYKGARKAVEQFCNEQKIGFVPLPDSGGSAIICK